MKRGGAVGWHRAAGTLDMSENVSQRDAGERGCAGGGRRGSWDRFQPRVVIEKSAGRHNYLVAISRLLRRRRRKERVLPRATALRPAESIEGGILKGLGGGNAL